MAVQYKQMKVEELVNEILSGEINFRGIELPQGANLANYEGFHEMQKYLKSQNLQESPIDLSNSRLIGLYAPTIYLPYSKLEGANFWRAYLRGADLRGSKLGGADLGGASLMRADLGGADLIGAELWGANLRGTNLRKALLDEAEPYKSRHKRG